MGEKQQQFIWLFLINFCNFMGINSMNMLPAYLADLGAGISLIGAFNTVPYLVLVVFVVLQLVRGRTYHKLRMLRLGFLFMFIGAAGMFVFRGKLPLMFLFYLLTGFSYATGYTNMFSLMFDIAPADRRRYYSAIFGISGLMTSGAAAAVAQFLYKTVAPHAIFFIPLLCAFAAALFSLRLKSGSFILIEKEDFSFARFSKKSGIGILIFQTLVYGGAFGIFKTFIPAFTETRLGFVDITRLFGFFTLIGIFYRLLFARFMDRFSRRSIQGAGYILFIAAILLLGRMTAAWQLYIIGSLYGLGQSLLFPVVSSEFIRIGEENRSAYNNIFIALFIAGQTISSTGLGLVAGKFGISVIPYIITGIVLIALLSLLRKEKN